MKKKRPRIKSTVLSGTIVTVTTASADGLIVGDPITIPQDKLEEFNKEANKCLCNIYKIHTGQTKVV